jgi:hypothetical protein
MTCATLVLIENGREMGGVAEKLPETRHTAGMPLANRPLRGVTMLDRQKVETILTRRFPHATRDQVAVSANAIMGLNEEWEEVPCHDFAALAAQCAEGYEFRVLRRRPF